MPVEQVETKKDDDGREFVRLPLPEKGFVTITVATLVHDGKPGGFLFAQHFELNEFIFSMADQEKVRQEVGDALTKTILPAIAAKVKEVSRG